MRFLFLIVLVLRLHIIFVCVFSPPFGWGERFVDFDQPKEAGLPWSVVVKISTQDAGSLVTTMTLQVKPDRGIPT